MEGIRKPFQGVWNIIRFNWHFYLLSLGISLLLILFSNYISENYSIYITILCLLIIGTTIISLLVSYYVYDLSGLYKMKWLDELNRIENSRIININAGFDETSSLLKNKFPGAALTVLDFYDPAKHTEASIKRARKAYPPFPDTIRINTSDIPLQENSADLIFATLAAHEIINEEERNTFFFEMNRVLKNDGRIIVTEHLRDFPNFLAYTIGFFHFIPKSSWRRTFGKTGLKVSEEIKNTPFITTFILEKHGTAS